MKPTSAITSTLRKSGVNVSSKPFTEIPSLRKGIIILYYSGGKDKFATAVKAAYPNSELSATGITAFIPDFS